MQWHSLGTSRGWGQFGEAASLPEPPRVSHLPRALCSSKAGRLKKINKQNPFTVISSYQVLGIVLSTSSAQCHLIFSATLSDSIMISSILQMSELRLVGWSGSWSSWQRNVLGSGGEVLVLSFPGPGPALGHSTPAPRSQCPSQRNGRLRERATRPGVSDWLPFRPCSGTVVCP